MDTLVRMRYLFDSLEPDEQRTAIKRITTTRGPQWIMALIFNHFAERLHTNSEDQSISTAIIKAISSVIIDRKTEPKYDDIESSTDDESDTEDDRLSIEELPSVMISKVASYLNQNDYLHFMHSSRRILIGCHSPFSLYHLNVYDRDQYSATRSLRPALTKRLSKSHVCDCGMKLRYGQRDAVNTARSLLNNSNIKRLTIIRKGGSSLDNGYNYLQFISHSPNIKCIETPISIPLSSSKLKLPTMPALKGTEYPFGTDIFSEVQRKLVRKHSKQMESLNLVSRNYYKNITSPNHQLCNLTELKIGRIFTELSERQLLFEWVKQSSKLKMFSIDWSNSGNIELIENMIAALFENHSNLQFTEFVYDNNYGSGLLFTERIGSGLARSCLKEQAKLNENKEFKVRIRLEVDRMKQLQQIREDVTKRLVEILSNHDHYGINKLKLDFDEGHRISFKGDLWDIKYKHHLGSFESFIRNHERFCIVDEGESTFNVKLIRNGTGDSSAWQKREERKYAQKIIDGLGHLIGILKECEVRHFMVQFVVRLTGFMRVSRQQNTEGLKRGMNDLMQKWKKEYRVDAFYESMDELEDDRWRITFCNKDNPMKGGYGAGGLFIE